jgi:hypothetical protein
LVQGKKYGWGWTPVTPQGWIIVGAYIVLVYAGVAGFRRALDAGLDAWPATALLILWVAISSAALIGIALATGEPPRWRWGK